MIMTYSHAKVRSLGSEDRAITTRRIDVVSNNKRTMKNNNAKYPITALDSVAYTTLIIAVNKSNRRGQRTASRPMSFPSGLGYGV